MMVGDNNSVCVERRKIPASLGLAATHLSRRRSISVLSPFSSIFSTRRSGGIELQAEFERMGLARRSLAHFRTERANFFAFLAADRRIEPKVRTFHAAAGRAFKLNGENGNA